MNTKKVIIGVSGDIGSFSEQAAIHYSEASQLKATINHLIDMERVLAALEKGEIDLGIFPVVNNRGGLVKQAFEAMGKYKFIYASSFTLNIEQCLLAKSPINLMKITSVVSHPQGLAQCALFIQKNLPRATTVVAEDTAVAARNLAAGMYDDLHAVIAPEACAKEYGLHVLKKSIQDQQPNLTTFIVTKRLENEKS